MFPFREIQAKISKIIRYRYFFRFPVKQSDDLGMPARYAISPGLEGSVFLVCANDHYNTVILPKSSGNGVDVMVVETVSYCW